MIDWEACNAGQVNNLPWKGSWKIWQKWLVKCCPPLLGLAPLQLYLLLPTFLNNERYNIPSFIEKKNRKQQQKTKRLIALEINNKKWNLPTPLPLPSGKKYLLNSSRLAIYKAKKKKIQPPLQPTSLNIPSHENIATAKKKHYKKTNLYYTTNTTKKLVEFWNRSNHMRQQQTILVIKLQQSFILPFFFDCKKTYSLSLISENQNIIIDKTKLEKRNVIIDYSLLSIQFWATDFEYKN